VIELLRSDTEAAALGRAARAHVEQRFGWDRIGRQFVELASSLAGESATPRDSLRSSSKLA
jgi:glycosyltransferase involved in cell wall biosynthesis